MPSIWLSIAYSLVINCSLNNVMREDINSEYFVPVMQAEKILFLFCSDFHIDLAKHTAPWLPAAEQTQPWGDGKPDCVQIRTCSIPPRTICIFFPASRKLKGMQINTGLCEGIVMSWNNEVQCILFHCGAWLDCQDLTEGRRGCMNKKGKSNRYWVRPSFANICRAFMSCSVVCGLALVQTIRGAQRVCPGLSVAWLCLVTSYRMMNKCQCSEKVMKTKVGSTWSEV